MVRKLDSRVLGLLAGLALAGTAQASDTKVALVPGGPHPYFAAWEQAAADAKKEFGIARPTTRCRPKWELSPAERADREPGRPGLQRLPGVPRRRRRHQRHVAGARRQRHPVGGARRLRQGPDQGRCSASAPTSTARPISAPRS